MLYRFCLIILVFSFIVFLSSQPALAESVNAPSLKTDNLIIQVETKAHLPQTLYQTPSDPNLPQIGVAKSFISQFFSKNILCNIIGLFCPEELNLAGGKTNQFVNLSNLMVQSEKPIELQLTPPSQATTVADINTEQKKTTGNTQLNSLSSSLDQYYSANAPDFPDFQPLNINCDQPAQANYNPQNPYCLERKNSPIQLGDKPIEGDDRAPNTVVKRKYTFNQAFYPPEIEPLSR